MNKQQVIGLVRHILTFAGGYAVARGFLSDALVGEIVGAIVTIVGAVWSIAAPEKA